jgi:hypothetical protein
VYNDGGSARTSTLRKSTLLDENHNAENSS